MHCYLPLLVAGLGIISTVAPCRAQEPVRLMPLVVQWRYPDSEIHGASMEDGLTVDRSGKRTVASIVCKTVFTTKDPLAKVVEYYQTELTQGVKPATGRAEGPLAADSSRSVMFHEDSAGRPLQVFIILVNQEKSSTTLVISRADTESETHIAWTRYMRF